MPTRLRLYQVDAFSSQVFGGNPAAVCPLDAWLPDEVLQAIAAENNLSETAFVLRDEVRGWQIRWFTPLQEVDLCGHATLAAAYILFTRLAPGLERAQFNSRSGPLVVTQQEGEWMEMDFPSRPPEPCALPEGLVEALGAEPRETLLSRDLLAVFDTEEQVRALAPDMAKLAQLEYFAVTATARGSEADFVSRFFAPRVGVPEDPVTGSAHCTLVPYWAQKLGKRQLLAHQISHRGGVLQCEDRGERVGISGQAVLYLEGHISL
ncbi:MAG TPA: PhzF family phenazine biosynthesis protein [Archangium sp.]|uniref:PhzF family phenazine biosynthesis protein n=1 Tax=Archangium sp. TaxID=1872627 RepID=UPI002E31A252|nr:PhzF family phenazine biosynthesis protein [Archangium sp.]HEX5748185.1 PhzF family phenazine biosynthesis protein [Archangium sp.]